MTDDDDNGGGDDDDEKAMTGGTRQRLEYIKPFRRGRARRRRERPTIVSLITQGQDQDNDVQDFLANIYIKSGYDVSCCTGIKILFSPSREGTRRVAEEKKYLVHEFAQMYVRTYYTGILVPTRENYNVGTMVPTYIYLIIITYFLV